MTKRAGGAILDFQISRHAVGSQPMFTCCPVRLKAGGNGADHEIQPTNPLKGEQ